MPRLQFFSQESGKVNNVPLVRFSIIWTWHLSRNFCRFSEIEINKSSMHATFCFLFRNGGRCYRECVPRGFLTGSYEGGLGAGSVEATSSPPQHCLWIISVHSFLNDAASKAHTYDELLESQCRTCKLKDSIAFLHCLLSL